MPTLFAFLPVIDRPYVIRREYKTEILTARSGAEQRRSLRATPRKTIEFKTTLNEANTLDFHRLMTSAQSGELRLHEHVRYVSSTSALASGGYSVDLDSVPDWLAAGDYAVLVNDFDMALVQIDTLDNSPPTGVSFVDAAAQDWPIGTRLHPALPGYLAPELKTAQRWKKRLDVSVSFAVSPGSEAAESEGSATESYDGREVWVDQPNSFDPIDLTHIIDRETIDAGQGIIAPFFPGDLTARLWQANYTRLEFSNAEGLRQLFARQQGPRGEFFMPTFDNDLPPLNQANSGTASLTVGSEDVATYFDGHPAYVGICAVLSDGSYHYNKVSSIAAGSGQSVLSLVDNWDADIPTDATVSWMPLWRFASDALELEFIMERLAKTQFALRMLAYNAAETA